MASSPPTAPTSEDLRASRLSVVEFNLDLDQLDDTSHDADAVALSSFTDKWKSAVKSVQDYKRGEAAAIRRVLEETEVVALKRTNEGFNQMNFTLGVLNCFVISYIIGACPEHLWLLYVVESAYLIPRKFYNMWHAKPLNQALYYLDFCWAMNFLAILLLVCLALSETVGLDIAEGTRKTYFMASQGVACGVLLSTNIVLPFVACLFHDVNSMTAFFIHFLPPLVMYTFMWNSEDISAAWPGVFSISSYIGQITYYGGLDSVAWCATALYFLWFIFYISFMLLVGINLPRKYNHNGTDAHPEWDTVFHSTMRQGVAIPIGKFFRGRSRAESLKLMEDNAFDLPDFFIYMGAHMTAALGAIYTVGYGCFSNRYFHLAMLGGSVVLAVIRGATRYTYYSTKMYQRTLRKQFAHILAEEGSTEGYSRLS
ncbi:hypothetical protein ACHAXT_012696 [Thalassiosira profunda]